MLLSHGAWLRYFGGATTVIGQPVLLDGRAVSVVGVLGPGFRFYPNPEAEFWIPFVLPTSEFLMAPVLAQLSPGVSTEAAVTEIATVLQQLRGTPERGHFAIVRAQDQMVAAVKPALLVLASAVGFVLLIAIVNVANLVLARTMTREREIAVRRALGAGAARIARLFLAESLVLALSGGVAGIGLAFGGVELLRVLGTTVPQQDAATRISIPRLNEVGVDASTLLCALVVTLIASVIFGFAPALRRHSIGAADVLRGDTARVGVFDRRGPRLRRLLVVGEIALAMVLLVGAALMMTSFVKLATVKTGFDPDGVVTFQATLPQGIEMATFAEALVARFRDVEGVRAAGYSSAGPMTLNHGNFPLRSTPRRDPVAAGEPTADPVYVSRDYFTAMGIDIVVGRGFDDGDRVGGQQVMLVNRSLARSGMVGANPLGVRVYALFRKPWEIVGIVEDTRLHALDQEPHPQFFIDLRQLPGFPFEQFRPYFAIRTDGDVTRVLSNLRDIVRQVEPKATVDNVATMDRIVWNSIARPRLYAVFIAVFAVVALLLAAIGIFGLLAYLVEQRTTEIGIRMALGAQRSMVMMAILAHTGLLVVIGVGGGLVAAAGLTRYLEGLLFGLTPLDPMTFAGASTVFVIVALVASYVPARRATRVDPIVALRAE